MKKRALVMVVAIMVTVTAFVGGTLAWFTDSETLEPSVYTVGNVNISVSGGAVSGTLLPGVDAYSYNLNDLVDDPTVTVETGSVKCYVFVEIAPKFGTEVIDYNGITADALIDYDIYGDNVWTLLGGNVYYQIVEASDVNVNLPIYDKVYTDTYVTKAMFDTVANDTVLLDVKVYAIQFDGIADVNAAWTAVSSQADSDEIIYDGGEVITE